MANMHQHGRYRPGPDAIGPFAVGILLVVISVVIGFAIAAITGSPGSSASIEAAGPTACIDVTPATATVGLARGNAGGAAVTFGFLAFDGELIDGGTITDFGPPPASVCRGPLDDDDDSMPMEASR